MEQFSIFDYQPPKANFSGETYSPSRDFVRLNKQAQAVFEAMKDGQWRTLNEISFITHAPESSISARLRDFRKERFGSHTVSRRHVKNGLHEYQLIPSFLPTV